MIRIAAMVLARTGKRMREADDEVYLDNFHSNKRYLTEVISSSLNGLTVGDVGASGLPSVDFSEAQSRSVSKSTSSFRNYGEEMSPRDSVMSDDSEESVGFRMARIFHDRGTYDPAAFTYPGSPDRNHQTISTNTSPVRSLSRSYSCPLTPSTSSVRRQRSKTSPECRFPPSPSDSCQPPDLRRTALMRALQIRARSPGVGLQSYDPRLQQILEKDKSNWNPSAAESIELPPPGSPLHGQLPPQIVRPSTSARSLHLEEKPAESESVATAEEDMDGSADSIAEKRSRSKAGGECCFRLKRGKFCEYSVRSFADMSDTESSL